MTVDTTATTEYRDLVHQLNNALAAALGRIEICSDVIDDELEPSAHNVLKECLDEAATAIVHAGSYVQDFAGRTAPA